MLRKIKNSEKGFTLVELVVVIAILAILAALLVPRIMGSVKDARESSELTKARTIAEEIAVFNAREMVKSDGGNPIKATTTDITIGATHMTRLGMDASALPEASIADILVDSAGNAKVVDHR